ncbi:Alw26I/Eco31I/Esp3I family type II restriction adenine-specific DNA-methyltransferase [Proteinivorax tanatarense]|uniref:site-specific DNA-methyltransferase (adenine-specific) n=1 Tax=Proteinivorax tanatarense TaxID=1260629 RepID=A0AAU7VKN6_9FIRM
MNSITKLHTEIFSKQYYDFIEKNVLGEFETAKILGQFYTNFNVARKMITEVIENYHFNQPTIKIIDPFCGDGRLLKLFIELLSEKGLKDIKLEIEIWDISLDNVQEAEKGIKETATQYSVDISTTKRVADAYINYRSFSCGFDICITNPPWGILKPQKVFNSKHNEIKIEEYKAAISTYDSYMKQEFYLSQPTSKFGKWGTNLSRCGVEVALHLVQQKGVCGLVSPASLLSDQVSVPLRRWIFQNHKVFNINYYPAEAKLYGKADTSSISMVLKKGEEEPNICVSLFNRELECRTHLLNESEYDYIKQQSYTFPFAIGIEKIPLLMKFEQFRTIEYYSSLWGVKFTREIDETRISEKLKETGNIVFIKGYMVDRFGIDINPIKYIDESIVTVPASVYKDKIVWRDVARLSSKRTMKAAIVKKGYIAGNSLGTAYLGSDNLNLLKALLVIMNSFVFEMQVRALLTTNHVSAGIIKKLKIPKIDKHTEYIAAMYDKFLEGEKITEQDLECTVAKIYKLSKDEFFDLLSIFQIDEDEKELLRRSANRILNYERLVDYDR